MLILTVASIVVSLLWAAVWFFHLRPQWMGAPDLHVGEGGTGLEGGISIVIPARNEEERLPGLLESLGLAAGEILEILVVDDHSEDGTAAAVRRAMKSDSRIRLLSSPPRPAGWAGKPWALSKGVTETAGRWLLFVDADVILDATALEAACRAVEGEDLDALSLLPPMKTPSAAGTMLLACYTLSRCLLFRPARPGRPGLVQGQFLLVRREAYEKAGGYERVRHSLIEDVDFGARLQEAGFRVRTRRAGKFLTTRLPDSFAGTWESFRKHLFPAFGFSLGRTAAITLLHLVLFTFPALFLALFPLFFQQDRTDSILTAAAFPASILTLTVIYRMIFVTLRDELFPTPVMLLVPPTYLLFALLLMQSVRDYRRGSVTWKGRSYGRAFFGAAEHREKDSTVARKSG